MKVANRLVRFGLSQGWRRGVLGGNRFWVVAGGVAVIAHLAGRAAGKKTDVVFSEELPAGHSFTVTHEPRR